MDGARQKDQDRQTQAEAVAHPQKGKLPASQGSTALAWHHTLTATHASCCVWPESGLPAGAGAVMARHGRRGPWVGL